MRKGEYMKRIQKIVIVLWVLLAEVSLIQAIAGIRVNLKDFDVEEDEKYEEALVRDETWELIWHDEFDGSGPFDGKVWESERGFERNQEWQWYQPQNTYRDNGLLVLEARLDSIPNPNYQKGSRDWRRNRPFAPYSSGSVTTRKSFSFLYGQLEVRARIPAATGSWPAIWTLGKGSWPACGECDLMEFYLVDSVPTILANAAWSEMPHKDTWDDSKTPYTHFLQKDPEWAQKFHIWLMDWTEDYIRLYLDGELLNEIPLSKTINHDGRNPFHEPQFILLDHAIDIRATPHPDLFPMRYEVDYVRVYQKK